MCWCIKGLLWWENWVLMMPTYIGFCCLWSCTCLSPFGYPWCLLVCVTLELSLNFFRFHGRPIYGPGCSKPSVGPFNSVLFREAEKLLICCPGFSRSPGRPSDCWVFRGADKLLSRSGLQSMVCIYLCTTELHGGFQSVASVALYATEPPWVF